VSIWAARRITKPLGDLVQGTREAAGGNLKQQIQVRTGDEVEVLADNFAIMIQEIMTHREQLEQQLAEIKRLQHYTEKLLTSMSDGLLSVDMNGLVSSVNPAVCRMLKVKPGEITQGTRISEVLRDFSEIYGYLSEILRSPQDRNDREIRIQIAAQERILLVGVSILRDRGESPREIILNLHDITELKKLEASVRQTERLAALGTLAAGMAHEIRNPLSSIKTFVQLLPRKIEKPGFLAKFQNTVPRELNRINDLVEDLLDLAKIPKYHFEMIDVKRLLNGTLDFLDEELTAKNIHCNFDLDHTLPPLRADARQLSKAFNNLIRNAAQAMPDGGTLFIKACCSKANPDDAHKENIPDRWMKLIFQDTGAGIPVADVKNIFNPFFTTKDKGAGLGLAITHKVISEHGGRIKVTSQSGEGSRFVISLPL
jgi:two-component system sensor histidine kinase AtoS